MTRSSIHTAIPGLRVRTFNSGLTSELGGHRLVCTLEGSTVHTVTEGIEKGRTHDQKLHVEDRQGCVSSVNVGDCDRWDCVWPSRFSNQRHHQRPIRRGSA